MRKTLPSLRDLTIRFFVCGCLEKLTLHEITQFHKWVLAKEFLKAITLLLKPPNDQIPDTIKTRILTILETYDDFRQGICQCAYFLTTGDERKRVIDEIEEAHPIVTYYCLFWSYPFIKSIFPMPPRWNHTVIIVEIMLFLGACYQNDVTYIKGPQCQQLMSLYDPKLLAMAAFCIGEHIGSYEITGMFHTQKNQSDAIPTNEIEVVHFIIACKHGDYKKAGEIYSGSDKQLRLALMRALTFNTHSLAIIISDALKAGNVALLKHLAQYTKQEDSDDDSLQFMLLKEIRLRCNLIVSQEAQMVDWNNFVSHPEEVENQIVDWLEELGGIFPSTIQLFFERFRRGCFSRAQQQYMIHDQKTKEQCLDTLSTQRFMDATRTNAARDPGNVAILCWFAQQLSIARIQELKLEISGNFLNPENRDSAPLKHDDTRLLELWYTLHSPEEQQDILTSTHHHHPIFFTLRHAFEQDQLVLVRWLINKAKKENSATSTVRLQRIQENLMQSLLAHASRAGHTAVIEFFCNTYPPMWLETHKVTLVKAAVEGGQPAVVKFLYEHGTPEEQTEISTYLFSPTHFLYLFSGPRPITTLCLHALKQLEEIFYKRPQLLRHIKPIAWLFELAPQQAKKEILEANNCQILYELILFIRYRDLRSFDVMDYLLDRITPIDERIKIFDAFYKRIIKQLATYTQETEKIENWLAHKKSSFNPQATLFK